MEIFVIFIQEKLTRNQDGRNVTPDLNHGVTDKDEQMTNKEHLSTLSAEEWWLRVDWLFHCYGKSFTDTYEAVKAWLNKEYTPVKPVLSNEPDNPAKFCPVCYTQVLHGDKRCWRCITDIDWEK